MEYIDVYNSIPNLLITENNILVFEINSELHLQTM